jgi:hypothetical protein
MPIRKKSIHNIYKTPGRTEPMRYVELSSTDQIKDLIEKLKVNYRDLSKILIPNEHETTVKGNKVISIFWNFELVMKIEGEESVINQFLKSLEEEKKEY